MSREPINGTITNSEGVEMIYNFNTMKARKAFIIKARLARTIIPSIAAAGNNFGSIMKAIKAAKQTDTTDAYDNINIDFTSIVEKLLNHMTDEQFLHLVIELFTGIMITLPGAKSVITLGDNVAFDDLFEAEFGMMYVLLGKVLEANFGSLFGKSGIGGVTNLIKTAQTKITQA